MTSTQRIFWLGMHKILVQTELLRLRQLGYEVFNPPYLSSVQDQSACLDWDEKQPTTLPPEIFDKLSRYNFFYNSISKEIAELLNAYFDAVIVTISPAWLSEVLKCYKGKVVYRVYGQHYLISQELAANKLIHNIVSRDNFWFVPHALEAVKDEDSWLREREVVVPYCLPSDVFEYSDSWSTVEPKWPKIAITCPNIKNPYFQAHYKFLQANFGETYNRYYGVQLSKIADSRVVGTLPRDELLFCFQKSAGYLYTYTDERVCYLPPIEMMILGGPVLYLQGSLLDLYFKLNSPGRCVSVEDARKKSKWLIQRDATFIGETIASQNGVRARYTPDDVWPIFDRAFQDILNKQNYAPRWLAIENEKVSSEIKRIYIFHHFPVSPIVYRDGTYTAYDGIPRVIRQVAMILATKPNVEVCVTSLADQVASMSGYFRDHPNRDRIRILCINPVDITQTPNTFLGRTHKFKSMAWEFLKKIVKKPTKMVTPSRYHPVARNFVTKIKESYRNICQHVNSFFDKNNWYIDLINDDRNCSAVLIPHYYLFPDALTLKKKIVLYLPDYMPHFFHETGEFKQTEGVHTETGRLLAKKADAVFCNSNFTKSYLPESRLNVSPEKIHVSYLPCLNTVNNENNQSGELPEDIYSKPYIFYPTRPRPNKNLSFLLRVFDKLVTDGYDINLVLTTTIECDSKAMQIFQSLRHKNRIIFLDVVTDNMLAQLYRNAALLCFTSLAEGNFPPQIDEALHYETPIVAGRLGFITERIPDHLLDSLILCESNNEHDFIEGCKQALHHRESVLNKQKQLYEVMRSEDINSHFRNKVLEIFNLA